MVYFIDLCKLLVKSDLTKPSYLDLLNKNIITVTKVLTSFVIRQKFSYIIWKLVRYDISKININENFSNT